MHCFKTLSRMALVLCTALVLTAATPASAQGSPRYVLMHRATGLCLGIFMEDIETTFLTGCNQSWTPMFRLLSDRYGTKIQLYNANSDGDTCLVTSGWTPTLQRNCLPSIYSRWSVSWVGTGYQISTPRDGGRVYLGSTAAWSGEYRIYVDTNLQYDPGSVWTLLRR